MIKFRYFGDRSKRHTNVITCATVIENNVLKVSFSFSNIKDVYDKNTGKLKALYKLSGGSFDEFILDNDEYTTHTITNLIRAHIYENSTRFPSWAKTVLSYRVQN